MLHSTGADYASAALLQVPGNVVLQRTVLLQWPGRCGEGVVVIVEQRQGLSVWRHLLMQEWNPSEGHPGTAQGSPQRSMIREELLLFRLVERTSGSAKEEAAGLVI